MDKIAGRHCSILLRFSIAGVNAGCLGYIAPNIVTSLSLEFEGQRLSGLVAIFRYNAQAVATDRRVEFMLKIRGIIGKWRASLETIYQH